MRSGSRLPRGTRVVTLVGLGMSLIFTGCPGTVSQPAAEPEPTSSSPVRGPSAAPMINPLQPAGTSSGPATPLDIAVLADGSAWILSAPEATDDSTPSLIRMDRQGTEITRQPLAGSVNRLTTGPDGTCWLIGHAPDTLWRIPPSGPAASASAPLPLTEAPLGLAWAGNRRLWWSEASGSRVVGWHPEATPSCVTWTVPEGVAPSLAASSESVWVVSTGSRTAWRLDAGTGALMTSLQLSAPAAGPLAVDVNGFAWIAIAAADGGTSLQKLDSNRVIRTVTAARSPLSRVTADPLGYVWMLSREASTLMRLVPATVEQRIFWDGTMVRPQAMGTNETGETWVASPGTITRFVVGS